MPSHLSAPAVGYDLEGSLLEVCSCEVLCPCWVGEDPDHGTCEAIIAYHFTRGRIRDQDVAGRTYVQINKIPGNVLTPKSWTVLIYVDDGASEAQQQAIVDTFTGKLGGPLADLSGLYGEILDVRRAPIGHEIVDGSGTLRIAEAVSASMRPYHGPDGVTATTLRDSLFSTVPGSPAYVAKADHHDVNLPEYDMVWSFQGRNAIQSDWRISHQEPA